MHNIPPTYRLGPDFHTRLQSFVDDFLSAGMACFAEEFRGIDSFVAMAKTDRSCRDDHELRRTEKPYYLLEAVSFKIYDDLNREPFNLTTDTVIILPDCLTLHNPDCLKEDLPHGDECRECTPACQVYEMQELARRYGATAVFSKRKLKEQIEYYSKRKNNLGVVGVGCLLMLADGMRTAMDLGVPVRGVPLNFTGCEHWNETPFASTFPLCLLEAILKEKHGTADSTP